MKRIKVLYCVADLNNAGPTTQLYNIIKNIDLTLYEPSLIVLKKITNEEKKILFKKIISFVEIGKQKKVKKIKEILKNYNPDIVQTSGFLSDIYISLLRKHVKKHIITVRSNTKLEYTTRRGKILGNIYYKIHRYAFSKADVIVACSKSIRSVLQSEGIESTLIYNGVDVDYYRDESNKFPFGRFELKFLSVGKFSPEKNQGLILKVFNDLSKKYSNISLDLYGSGTLLDGFKKLYHNNKYIHFHGNVKDMHGVYGKYDAFISSSLSEGMPNVVLEALSANTLSVLSNIKPHQELKVAFDKSIILFENNYDSLYFTLENLVIKMDMFTSLDSSKDVKSSQFSSVQMSKKYQELYLKC